ncbi:hypothetical protein ABZX85_42460 [Streptomyces sp. NPDC004539]|uniref:hypothetical protein n=1 Tax=Streptomyces sp. NPDC004539 TaxID=3154280 RepID=UPI0033A04E35
MAPDGVRQTQRCPRNGAPSSTGDRADRVSPLLIDLTQLQVRQGVQEIQGVGGGADGFGFLGGLE